MVALGLLYVNLPQYIDHRWFAYVGGAMLEGNRPYLEVGDLNFPGVFFMHALALFLFGYNSWAFPLLDYIFLLAFVLIMARTLGVRKSREEALVFLVLYPLVYVTLGSPMAGQRDLLSAHLVLLAGAFLLRRVEGGHWSWLILDGLAVFMAVVMKPTFAIFAPALPLMDLAARPQSGRTLRRIATDHAIEGASVAAALGAMLLVGWVSGVLWASYEWLIFNVEIFSTLKQPTSFLLERTRHLAMTYWPAYLVVGAVGFVRWFRYGDRPLLVLVLSSFATTVVSVVVQHKGFDYHFVAIIPGLSLLMSDALGWCCPRLRCCGSSGHAWRGARLRRLLWPLFWCS